MEPQKKVLVSEDFLSSTHGEIDCENCHGGNPSSKGKVAAHAEMDPHPSINDPENACGECHEEIVTTARDSLHATLSTYPVVLNSRANIDNLGLIENARKNHCTACHTSCGGCHVSRPKFAQKGFVNGHVFQKRPDPLNQCTACHGSRVGNEYYGQRGQGDVHAAKAAMDCTHCHQAGEMHAAARKDMKSRYELSEMVRCSDCHKDLQLGSVREHSIHYRKVQCQVCHSQTYINCYSCHVGKDSEGIPYFQTKGEMESMKIGRNYDRTTPDAEYNYMLVRHVPSDPEMFDFYGKDGFTRFDSTPTWKRTSPHNIQRRTWQATNCNNCHGNRELFLSDADLLDYEKEANRNVVVSDESLPKALTRTQKFSVDTSNVRTEMVVDAEWLHSNFNKTKLLVIDARNAAAYEKGHIKGAILLDPITSSLRSGADAKRLFVLAEHEKVTAIFGSKGIAADGHIVVYDQNGSIAGALIAVLQWAGAAHVSYLNGGMEGWHHAGFPTSTKASTRKACVFTGNAKSDWIEDSASVARLLELRHTTVVIDSRPITKILGITKHDKTSRAGAIPGSINVPLGALYMNDGFLKPPAELLWMLKTYGITPEKTVITTCNTGFAAADASFVLRYLGFPDVRVHDEAWVNWSLTR